MRERQRERKRMRERERERQRERIFIIPGFFSLPRQQVVPNVDLSSYLSMPLYTLLQATNQGSKGNAGSPTHILQKIQGIPILAGPPPGAAAVLRQVHVPSSQNPSSGAKREAGVLMVDCAGGAGVSGDGGGENDGDGARILSPSYVESPLLSLAAAAASTEE